MTESSHRGHLNVSRYDLASGENVFALPKEQDPRGLGLSPLGYQLGAGILRHGRAPCAAFAPTVNSYERRIRRVAMAFYSWAPVFNSVGASNRSSAPRVPMAGGRCEDRNAGSSMNPCLAASGVQPLPKTLGEAVDACEADPFVERVLGAALRGAFVKYKRAEWDEYHQYVGGWEIRRYAKFF